MNILTRFSSTLTIIFFQISSNYIVKMINYLNIYFLKESFENLFQFITNIWEYISKKQDLLFRHLWSNKNPSIEYIFNEIFTSYWGLDLRSSCNLRSSVLDYLFRNINIRNRNVLDRKWKIGRSLIWTCIITWRCMMSDINKMFSILTCFVNLFY